jgi:phospholipase D1/2
MDWWLSPELYLRRPPNHFEGYRVDRLLKRKAEEGVQVRIIVYKEVTSTMTMSSAYTKHHFEDLHENIKVVRHPDHSGGEIGLFWSHHNKVVCVDNARACVGGLDICYGRWDTQMHPLADVHPNHLLERTLFPGQDYNNARVQDFQHVSEFMSNQQSPLAVGRMPWHDVHVSFYGPAVLDIAHLFAERWNFIKDLKYHSNKGYSHIAFPHGAPKLEEVAEVHDAVARHPRTEKFHEVGQVFRHPFHADKRELHVPDVDFTNCGPMDVQVIRSAGDWSNGTLTEHSIMNAYVEMIREANHYIYMENQFFITATDDSGPVINTIGAAIVQRILSAAKDKRKFKIIVVIPTIPCFAGELQEAAGIRCIMDYQYKSISRGGKSIMERCSEQGVDANEYISFYNLRGIDRINTSRVREMEKKSGIGFHQAQVAAARVYLGEQGMVGGQQKVAIRAAEDTSQGDKKKDKDGKTKAKVIEEVELPKTIDEAMEILRKFQSAVPEADEHVKDSIAGNVLHGQTPIKDEPWPSSDEEEEKEAYVTEETYVHSKLLIVDDRRVLIGSANLNDRSQKGNGDSETAVVIEDTNTFETKMNGEKYMAAPFAASFRRHLWRQHLGLIPSQECNDVTAKTYPTDAMRPAPFANPDPVQLAKESEWERIVEDPLSDELEKMWKGQAKSNTDIADEIFQVVPTDKVRNWKQYEEFFIARGPRTGHVASESEAADVDADRLKLTCYYRQRYATVAHQRETQRLAWLSCQHVFALLGGRRCECAPSLMQFLPDPLSYISSSRKVPEEWRSTMLPFPFVSAGIKTRIMGLSLTIEIILTDL